MPNSMVFFPFSSPLGVTFSHSAGTREGRLHQYHVAGDRFASACCPGLRGRRSSGLVQRAAHGSAEAVHNRPRRSRRVILRYRRPTNDDAHAVRRPASASASIVSPSPASLS